ncbi:hypothetical protein D3C81_1246500 [compost metagenome]
MTNTVDVRTKNQPKLTMTQDCAVVALAARLAWLTTPQVMKAIASKLVTPNTAQSSLPSRWRSCLASAVLDGSVTPSGGVSTFSCVAIDGPFSVLLQAFVVVIGSDACARTEGGRAGGPVIIL